MSVLLQDTIGFGDYLGEKIHDVISVVVVDCWVRVAFFRLAFIQIYAIRRISHYAVVSACCELLGFCDCITQDYFMLERT